MNWTKTAIICALILLVGGGALALIFATEPTAKRGGATRKTAMLVEVTRAQRGDFRPTIAAMGTVEPEREIVLSPRVSGELVERAPAFTPGGRLKKGETLLRIDPRDYRNALSQRKGDLARARADLRVEMGRQDVARQDYRLYNEELPEEKKALVLRAPQLEAAKARVEAARAAVRQAELELGRTRITAPFNAHVLSREVDVGSQVAPGDRLGRLVGLDTYWVVATVPQVKLERIAFPGANGGEGAKVSIYNRAAWPEGAVRAGRVVSLIGALEKRTRLARILVAVDDPLAVSPGAHGKPALMIGAFVEAQIEAEIIDDVLRLERDYLRQGDKVWINEEGRLSIRDVEVIFRDAQYAYIRSGLDEDDLVVTTNLSTATEGSALRLKGAGEAGAGQAANDSGRHRAEGAGQSSGGSG
ncbi:MAG: efflux RND transporter periplasmic adaptor subunit [Desulfuromonadales bacterium]|nr:efflux RND transporter periplasmic adaptor subunit [Desulfuromonadales bacterium]NIR33329.1 efflux RND transporter periplasmic adaptor subunit [Desulfuromonadales bacterium]NIS42115.1 efflux RND transporter periplasmic adaptor subunit [Desulfuromonadales bacterium]